MEIADFEPKNVEVAGFATNIAVFDFHILASDHLGKVFIATFFSSIHSSIHIVPAILDALLKKEVVKCLLHLNLIRYQIKITQLAKLLVPTDNVHLCLYEITVK